MDGAGAGLTFTRNGVPLAVTANRLTARMIEYTLDTDTIYLGDTVLRTYSQVSGDITDLYGVEMGAFTGSAVVNNATDLAPGDPGDILSIALSLSAATTRPGGLVTASASINGVDPYNDNVLYSVQTPSAGWIENVSGVFHAPINPTVSSVVIRVTSVADPTKYDEDTLTIFGFREVTETTNENYSRLRLSTLLAIPSGSSTSTPLAVGDGYLVRIEWEASVEGNQFVVEVSDNGSDWAIAKDESDQNIVITHTGSAGSEDFDTAIFGRIQYLRVRSYNSGSAQNQTGAQVVRVITEQYQEPLYA